MVWLTDYLIREKSNMEKQGIAPSKLLIGVLVIAAFLFAGIQIPESRGILALFVLFGFFGFLEWLEK